jgi:hypothetical protein
VSNSTKFLLDEIATNPTFVPFCIASSLYPA